MKDFLGRDVKVGDYLATGGTGNTRSEYGMILCRVLTVEPHIKVVRINVTYTNGSHELGHYHYIVQNPNKYVLVDPPEQWRELFESVIAGNADLKPKEAKDLIKWIHGIKK